MNKKGKFKMKKPPYFPIVLPTVTSKGYHFDITEEHIRASLKLTPAQRLRQLGKAQRFWRESVPKKTRLLYEKFMKKES